MPNEIENLVRDLGISIAFLLPFALIGLFLIDRIFKRLHESFNDDWLNYGKPCGLFYCPSGTKNIRSMLTMQKLMFTWLFKTPAWIKSDVYATSCLLKVKTCTLIWNIGILLLFMYMFVLYGDILLNQ